jgi:hypothetical protein
MKPIVLAATLAFAAGVFAQGVLHDRASVEIVERAPQFARIRPLTIFCQIRFSRDIAARDWSQRFALNPTLSHLSQ